MAAADVILYLNYRWCITNNTANKIIQDKSNNFPIVKFTLEDNTVSPRGLRLPTVNALQVKVGVPGLETLFAKKYTELFDK